MNIVDALISNAEADVEVLQSLDSNGDDFRQFRDVEFLLIAPDAKRGKLIRDFVNDYRYGKASYQKTDGAHHVSVAVNMPVTQHLITSVAGFFVCVAQIYNAEFDGWECAAMKSE